MVRSAVTAIFYFRTRSLSSDKPKITTKSNRRKEERTPKIPHFQNIEVRSQSAEIIPINWCHILSIRNRGNAAGASWPQAVPDKNNKNGFHHPHLPLPSWEDWAVPLLPTKLSDLILTGDSRSMNEFFISPSRKPSFMCRIYLSF